MVVSDPYHLQYFSVTVLRTTLLLVPTYSNARYSALGSAVEPETKWQKCFLFSNFIPSASKQLSWLRAHSSTRTSFAVRHTHSIPH